MKNVFNDFLIDLNSIFQYSNLKEIKLLSKRIIHTNHIYICKSDNGKKEFVIKFYKTEDIMEKERFCNTYLENKGLCVPKIISYNKSPKPYVIMNKINGKKPYRKDISKRIKDLAKVHIESLKDIHLNSIIPKLTKENRIKSIERDIKILRSNPLIKRDYLNRFNSFIDTSKEIDYGLWEQCFCFNDFFINNSIKDKNNIYYFDFEKAVVSSPFVDVGCVVIDYPQAYTKIKSLYIKNIMLNLKAKKIYRIRDYLFNLGLFVDLGICEKVIEDAAFLSDSNIKKTKDNDFCKKLAKRKIESVLFIFDNLKNKLLEGK